MAPGLMAVNHMTKRKKILKKIGKVIEELDMQPVTTVPSEAMVVVARVEGYDTELDDEIWQHHGNKSEARDINCSGCDHQVMMSNDMYARLIAGEIKMKQVVCGQCVMKDL